MSFPFLQEWLNMRGPLRPLLQNAMDAVWQPVVDTRYELYVYSAFIERRKPAAIRVIAVTAKTTDDRLFCRLWLRDDRIYLLEAKLQYAKEDHNKFNVVVFILCLLNNLNPDKAIGGEVAIVSKSASTRLASNLIKVIDTTPKNDSEVNIHVCVRPLHGSYNDVEWMVEWIELNRMLGVSHFYFYNMSVGDRIDCLLKNYINQTDLITLLPFQLPVTEIWAEGQLASSHDCLYRSISKADWLLIIDLDEIALPHKKGIERLKILHEGRYVRPYPAMFDMLAEDTEPYSFQFRNTFFYREWDDDTKSLAPLVTSRKTRRMQYIFWHGIRSKYAVRPSKVVQLGIHNVEEFATGTVSYNTFYIDPEIALLHHYRSDCESSQCGSQPSTVDRSAHRWSHRLWKRVQQRLKEIDQVCRRS